MIREIKAKTLLASVKQPDPWFGLRYNMNIYRGCQHQCIYCDSRSECYGIEDFRDVLVKTNALELLARELAGKRSKGRIGTGSMSDPYGPVEARYDLTGRALGIIAQHDFAVHILTKSDLVRKDLPTLREMGRARASVSFTITTADDELALKLEPGAPPPSRRFAAMRELAAAGGPEGLVVRAEEQTAGRGRHGRCWVAPPGTSLLFTVLLRPPTEAVEWLPMAAAVGVARAAACAGVPVVAVAGKAVFVGEVPSLGAIVGAVEQAEQVGKEMLCE